MGSEERPKPPEEAMMGCLRAGGQAGGSLRRSHVPPSGAMVLCLRAGGRLMGPSEGSALADRRHERSHHSPAASRLHEGHRHTSAEDDYVLMGSVGGSLENFGSNGGFGTPVVSPGGSSWDPLVGSPRPNTRAQPSTSHGDANRLGEKLEEGREHEKEEKEGEWFTCRFDQDTRGRGVDQEDSVLLGSLGCSSIARVSDVALGEPPCSPGGSSLDARTCSSGPDTSRRRLSIGHVYTRTGGETKNGDQEHEAKEEKEEGDSRFQFNQDTRNRSVEVLGRTSGSAGTPHGLQWAFHQQGFIIEEQKELLRGVIAKNRDLRQHAQYLEDENVRGRRLHRSEVALLQDDNERLRRQRSEMVLKYDELASQLAYFLARAGSATSTATATTQTPRAPARRNVHAELDTSMARGGRPMVENARRHRTEQGPRRSRELDANVSFPPIARENSPTPSVILASPARAQDKESPAARASAFLARESTPDTRSMTPPVGMAAIPAPTPAAGPALGEGAPEETRVAGGRKKASGCGRDSTRHPATASSARGTGRSTLPANRSANRPANRRQDATTSSASVGPTVGRFNLPTERRQGIVTSSRGAGRPAGPVNRPSARRPPTAAYSGGLGHSTRPIDRPPARQGRATKNATSCRQALDCTRGTITSKSRLRAAVKSTAPRGMVF